MMPSERRLHPLSPLFIVGASAWNLLVPGLLVLFAGWSGWGFEPWLIVAVVPYTVVGVIRYLTYRYRFEAGEMVVRTGLIFRNERHIPYARIQNVDVTQNFLHRLAGVAEVALETAGGQEPEARIRVLAVGAVDEMRRRVSEAKRIVGSSASPASPTAEATVATDRGVLPDERVLLQLSLSELALCGLVHNRGLVVAAAIAGVAWESGFVDSIQKWLFGTQVLTGRGYFRAAAKSVGNLGSPTLLGAAGILGGIVGLLVLVRILSMGWSIVKLHGFTLTASGQELKLRYGLLTRVTAAIPARRIQLISVRQTPLHRLFDRVTVRVDTAAVSAQAGEPVHHQWLAPILPRRELPGLLAAIEPGLDPPSDGWQPVDPRASRRMLRKSLVVGALVAVALVPLFGAWALLVLVVVLPSAIVDSRRAAAGLGYALTPQGVVFRCGWLWRHWSAAPYRKIQALTLAASPFDRRVGMARVRVDTAGAGESQQRIDIPYLEQGTARRLFEDLELRAAETPLRW